MKQDIHPELKNVKVLCTGCNNEFETLSVKDSITVAICSNCHPFFTGTNKLVDTEGRIAKFKRREQESRQKKEQHSKKKKQQEQDNESK